MNNSFCSYHSFLFCLYSEYCRSFPQLLTEIRERRKVQLVEQPGQKTAGRSPQATRAAPLNQSRPMSADDIQKAKMRAQFLQTKYKKASSSNENKVKTEGRKSSQVSILSSASKVPARPSIEEHKKTVAVRTKAPNVLEASIDPKPKVDLKEPLWEKCRRVQISWHTPPGIFLFVDFDWFLILTCSITP